MSTYHMEGGDSESDSEHEDKSYGLQLDTEIKEQRRPTEQLPEGLRYVADTRRQSINPAALNEAVAGVTKSTSESSQTRDSERKRGYLPIENYGIIGNLRTVALCGTDGSIDFLSYPTFESPTVFCRLLDNDKGGHFSIAPRVSHTTNKQQYLPNGNILTTRFLSDDGVAVVTDYMHMPAEGQRQTTKPLLPWIIRIVQVIRGTVPFRVECYPAFNYARDSHTTTLDTSQVKDGFDAPKLYPEDDVSYYAGKQRAKFTSQDTSMDLRYVVKCGDFECPYFNFKLDNFACASGFKGPGVYADFELQETQEVTFILRELPPSPNLEDDPPIEVKRKLAMDPVLSVSLMDALFRQTATYWQSWISQSSYKGRWREHVLRSALTLKLLTYEPVRLRMEKQLSENIY